MNERVALLPQKKLPGLKEELICLCSSEHCSIFNKMGQEDGRADKPLDILTFTLSSFLLITFAPCVPNSKSSSATTGPWS